jgi:hypothetical protein
MTQLPAIRADYPAAFNELKSSAKTEEGKRPLGQLEEVVTRWREAALIGFGLVSAFAAVSHGVLLTRSIYSGDFGRSSDARRVVHGTDGQFHRDYVRLARRLG